MNQFGKTSRKRLETCDWRLQEIHNHSIQFAPYDYGIACGHRGRADQEKAFSEGKSDLHYGQSSHNAEDEGRPNSKATDIYLWIDGVGIWGDESPEARTKMREAQRYIQGVAAGLGYLVSCMPTLRNGNEDLPHMQLVD